jgi:hypothetical protein
MSAAHEQYIRNLQGSIARHQRMVDVNHPAAAQAQGIVNRLTADLAAALTVRGGGGGGNQTTTAAAPTGPDPDTVRKNKAARAFLQDMFSSWGGMEDLIGEIDRLVRDYGNQPEVLTAEVRTLEPYKKRFVGFIRLREQGVTDIRNETEYLNLERDYRQVFREAGMRDFLGTDGTQVQFDSIAELVADYSVSVNEVKARIGDAARLVSSPDNLEAAALRDYYGIDTTTLTEYVLDPDRTMARVNEIANTALIGAQAARQELNINETTASRMADIAGAGDLLPGQYQQTIDGAVELRDEVSRLADIEGSELTDSEALLASANLDQSASKKVRGLRSRERARFGGRSGVTSSTLSRTSGY